MTDDFDITSSKEYKLLQAGQKKANEMGLMSGAFRKFKKAMNITSTKDLKAKAKKQANQKRDDLHQFALRTIRQVNDRVQGFGELQEMKERYDVERDKKFLIDLNVAISDFVQMSVLLEENMQNICLLHQPRIYFGGKDHVHDKKSGEKRSVDHDGLPVSSMLANSNSFSKYLSCQNHTLTA